VLDKRLFELAYSKLMARLILRQFLRIEASHIEHETIGAGNVTKIAFEEGLGLCRPNHLAIFNLHQAFQSVDQWHDQAVRIAVVHRIIEEVRGGLRGYIRGFVFSGFTLCGIIYFDDVARPETVVVRIIGIRKIRINLVVQRGQIGKDVEATCDGVVCELMRWPVAWLRHVRIKHELIELLRTFTLVPIDVLWRDADVEGEQTFFVGLIERDPRQSE
jgi:hypothetical protein